MAEPSPLRRKLGAELRRVRTLAGKSQHELGMHQTTASRIENAIGPPPSRKRVEPWLLLVEGPSDAELILTLLDAAHRETRSWDEVFDEHDEHLQDEIADRDRAARLVRNFQPTVIPGLLQVAAYAQATFSRSDTAAAVAARLERQQVLHEPGRRFEFIVTREVLQCVIAPRAREAQLHQLASLATLDSVELAVYDGDAPLIPWNNFVYREPADDPEAPYVTTELIHGPQEIRDPGMVNLYALTWSQLWEASEVKDDAVAVIRSELR